MGSRDMKRLAVAVALASMAAIGPLRAEGQGVTLSKAMAPVTAKGANAPLSVTISNPGDADVLLRARCDNVNFFELHTVDHGEGFPAMRVIKAIPIAAHGDTVLNPDGYHVMLLQATQPFAVGDSFACTLRFRDAGSQDVTVKVGAASAGE